MKTPLRLPIRIILVAAILSLVPTRASESPSLLLQKGIYVEEIERDLDSAIKIYEQIAAEAVTSRAVVAQAQYRLAVCYEKKGDKEQAIKLLRDLAEQAPTDSEVREKAKEGLATFGVDLARSPSARRISLPLQTNWLISISANGRCVAYQPRGTSDLAVSEIATGKTWTVFKGTKEESLWAAWLSPDGQWVAYQTSNVSLIRAAKTDGSEQRVLYDAAPNHEDCWMYDWAADGREIWFWSSNPDQRDKSVTEPIYSLNLATGARREVVRFPKKAGNGDWFVSPDQAAAVLLSESYPRRIGLWDLKKGEETVLLSREAGDVFGWFANGTKILYSKRRLEGIELLAVTVRDAKAIGEPEHLWTVAGEASAMRIGEDGSVYYAAPRDTAAAINMVDHWLWSIDRLLNRKVPVASLFAEIPPEDILGPDNSILDRKYGLSLKLPDGWTVSSTRRRDREQSGIWFNVPGLTAGRRMVWYGRNDKLDGNNWLPSVKPTTAKEIDAWLRERARLTVVQRMEQEHLDDYSNRSDSFVSRTVGGHPALTWSSTYSIRDRQYVEYHALVYGKDLHAWVAVACRAAESPAVKPALAGMIETIRLP